MKIEYIAEIGNNHNGDVVLAKEMIDAAIHAGADYIKFQIYNVEKFLAPNSRYFEEFEREALKYEDYIELKNYTTKQGGLFLATPFDEDSVKLLSEMNLDVIKIASGDMNNWQLLEMVATERKKLLVSIGGASVNETTKTVDFLKTTGCQFAILHCTIEYPASMDELYLREIPSLKKRYACQVGYSDHSLGIEASLGAIALGAEIIEKHFTIDTSLPGGDNGMSIVPAQLERLIREGDNIGLALGKGRRIFGVNEQKTKSLIRREIFAKRAIPKGSSLVDDDLLLLRPSTPGDGLGADYYSRLLGCKVNCDIAKGRIITSNLLDQEV